MHGHLTDMQARSEGTAHLRQALLEVCHSIPHVAHLFKGLPGRVLGLAGPHQGCHLAGSRLQRPGFSPGSACL